MNIAILVEFNPFHNGHKNLIEKIKRKYPESNLIALMSGDLVIRGGVSIFSKEERSLDAIKSGVDLVFSISPESSINAAGRFSKDLIENCIKLNIDRIIFGTESGDIKKIEDIANRINNDYIKIQKIMKENKTSLNQTISSLYKDISLLPNEILAVEYVRNIKSLKSNIKYETIKREHNKKNITSASKIRELIYSDKNYINFVPYDYSKRIKRNLNDFSNIFYHLLLRNDSKDSISIIKKTMNMITNKIRNNNHLSIDEIIDNFHTKNLTKSSLRRIITKEIFNIDNENNNYLRLMAYSEKGKGFLKNIDKSVYKSRIDKSMKSEIKINKILKTIYK